MKQSTIEMLHEAISRVISSNYYVHDLNYDNDEQQRTTQNATVCEPYQQCRCNKNDNHTTLAFTLNRTWYLSANLR